MNDIIITSVLVGIPAISVVLAIANVFLLTKKSSQINIWVTILVVLLPIVSFVLIFVDGIRADATGQVGNIFANQMANWFVLISIIVGLINLLRNFAKP
jgi:K+ transporter